MGLSITCIFLANTSYGASPIWTNGFNESMLFSKPYPWEKVLITPVIFSSPVQKYRDLLLSPRHKHRHWCHATKFFM